MNDLAEACSTCANLDYGFNMTLNVLLLDLHSNSLQWKSDCEPKNEEGIKSDPLE